MTTAFSLRCPAACTPSSIPVTPAIQPPFPQELWGRWHITHTSSPAWRDKRNVILTYSPLGTSAQPSTPMDDLITYQSLSSAKSQSVHGTDTPSPINPFAWTWRGNGWLKMVTSHWEILGYGDVEGCGQWMVVYAQKSVFTPAVINVYTREKQGLPEAILVPLKKALVDLAHGNLKVLVESMYSVQFEGT